MARAARRSGLPVRRAQRRGVRPIAGREPQRASSRAPATCRSTSLSSYPAVSRTRMTTRGAVAAGHPLTAEAGARVLRDGGNAVDASVAAVLTSFVTESPLTGLGAGGFMLVHTADEDMLLDFFVEMPGRGAERTSELVPVEILFDGTAQIFNIGAASCGVPGTAAGLAEALARFGSAPLDELAAPAARLAR